MSEKTPAQRALDGGVTVPGELLGVTDTTVMRGIRELASRKLVEIVRPGKPWKPGRYRVPSQERTAEGVLT